MIVVEDILTYGNSQVRSDSSTSNDDRVGSSVVTAETLEVLDGLRDGLVIITVGVEALVDVGDEGRVGAVARGVRVVNTADDVVPGGDTGGDNAGVRQGLGGGGCGRGLGHGSAAHRGDGSGRRRSGGGLLGRRRRGGAGTGGAGGSGAGNSGSLADGVAGGVDGGLGLSHGADGGGDGNNDSGDHLGLALSPGRAVGDSGSAGSDGLDGGGVDGAGANVASDEGGRSHVGSRLDGAGDSRGRDY